MSIQRSQAFRFTLLFLTLTIFNVINAELNDDLVEQKVKLCGQVLYKALVKRCGGDFNPIPNLRKFLESDEVPNDGPTPQLLYNRLKRQVQNDIFIRTATECCNYGCNFDDLGQFCLND